MLSIALLSGRYYPRPLFLDARAETMAEDSIENDRGSGGGGGRGGGADARTLALISLALILLIQSTRRTRLAFFVQASSSPASSSMSRPLKAARRARFIRKTPTLPREDASVSATARRRCNNSKTVILFAARIPARPLCAYVYICLYTYAYIYIYIYQRDVVRGEITRSVTPAAFLHRIFYRQGAHLEHPCRAVIVLYLLIEAVPGWSDFICAAAA